MRSRVVAVPVAFALVLGLVLAAPLRSVDAFAQTAPEKKAAPPADKSPKTPKTPKKTEAGKAPLAEVKVALAPAMAKIKSGDLAQIRAGLADARLAGPSAAPLGSAIADVLRGGASLSLTLAAIETLGDIEAEAASPVLAQYAVHRSAKIRRAALQSLARTKGAPAAAAFRRALRDPDAIARATAASGLGGLEARDAVPELLAALDRRVHEAAAAVGQLCRAEQCSELARKVGKVPFDVVVSGLERILFRPAAEVPDDVKLEIVRRVRELGTAEANKFLEVVRDRWPSSESARVRQALEQAVPSTSGGAK